MHLCVRLTVCEACDWVTVLIPEAIGHLGVPELTAENTGEGGPHQPTGHVPLTHSARVEVDILGVTVTRHGGRSVYGG